jgi:transcriptional regulator with XRE-family HTH domain
MATSNIDQKIGYKLKTRRNYLGITQGSLGSMLGVTFQQIQKYEKGINRVSVSKLKELSKILKVSIDYFLCEGHSIGVPLGDRNQEQLLTQQEIGENGDAIQNDANAVSEKELLTLIKHFRKIENKKVRSDTINLVRSLATGGK